MINTILLFIDIEYSNYINKIDINNIDTIKEEIR
jgi:hypothetical protein